MPKTRHVLWVVLLATGFALAGIGGALAQTPATAEPSPETLQAAKDLVALTSRTMIPELKENIGAKVWPQIEAAMRHQYPKIDNDTFSELHGDYDNLMNEAVTASTADAPAVYARHFTAAEMNEIAAFYRTPAGAKALSVMPKAMAELMPGLVTRVQAIGNKLQAQFAATLKKHGYTVQ